MHITKLLQTWLMETEDYPSELLSNQVSYHKITKYNLGRGKTPLYKLDQKDFTRLVILQLCHLNRAFTLPPITQSG